MMLNLTDWTPKSVLLLRKYTARDFLSDLIAGITVGLVALPLAMAFAIASGLPPQAGLFCAIAAGFLISALGGSKTQIGGPTGAFVVVVYGIVARYGVESLYICTLLAGILLVVLGVTGLGTAVKFIPPAYLMKQAEFEEHVGSQNICASIAEALERAKALFEELGANAPSVHQWGRRDEDAAQPVVAE
jgi:hypothetical protein